MAHRNMGTAGLLGIAAAIGGALYLLGKKKKSKHKGVSSQVSGIGYASKFLPRAGPCDLAIVDDSKFIGYLQEVSDGIFGSNTPPIGGAEEVLVEAFDSAAPECPWPPTDPEWRIHEDEVVGVTWPQAVAHMELIFEQIRSGPPGSTVWTSFQG